MSLCSGPNGVSSRIIYMAHPLGAGDDREANIVRAKRWLAWLITTYPYAYTAPWIQWAEIMTESEAMRERGLAFDCELIRRCDELWLVGGRVSPGMARERAAAVAAGVIVQDWTHLGLEPPEV